MSASIRRTDLLALSNLRNDGRKPHEIRRMKIQMGAVTDPSVGGSSVVEMGLTIALATVTGPLECQRRSDELNDRAILEVTIKMAPFASADRRVTNPNTDRRLMEQSYLIQRALESALLLSLFPKTRLQVVICILADDGGRLSAGINAATLALMDAGIPMKDFVCACSAGYAGSLSTTDDPTCLVDLNRREESSQGGQPAVNVPVAMMPQRGTMVMSQCEARLENFDRMGQVLEAAMEGCQAVFAYMQTAVRERASLLLGARSGRGAILVGEA